MTNRPIGERPGMAAYGTGSPDWKALPWDWAAERLIPNKNYWVVTVDSTVEAISVEGVAAPITDSGRIDAWVDRYVAKYGNEVADGDGLGDFVRSHAMFEVVPTKAIAIIEREEEFALRATRWQFT